MTGTSHRAVSPRCCTTWLISAVVLLLYTPNSGVARAVEGEVRLAGFTDRLDQRVVELMEVHDIPEKSRTRHGIE